MLKPAEIRKLKSQADVVISGIFPEVLETDLPMTAFSKGDRIAVIIVRVQE